MKKNDFLINFFDGLDAKSQAYLNYYFTREIMKERFISRAEKEDMKNEIIEDVLSRISIMLETEALNELRKLLNEIAN